MRAASTVLTLSFAAGLMTASTAEAIGFGRVATATQLGQRLDFGAVVHLDPGEALDRACVFAEVLAGDSLLQPGQLRVTLEGGPDTPDRTIRVSTSTVIEEPVVTVSLTVGCNSRSTRRFVVFIDPPGIELASSAEATDSALLVPQRVDSQLAPLVASLAPAPPRRAAARPRAAVVDRHLPRPARAETAVVAAAPPPRRPAEAASAVGERPKIVVAAAKKPPAPRHLAAVDKPPAAPRLQLDAPVLAVVGARGAASAARVATAEAPGASTPASSMAGEPSPASVATLLAAASAASAEQQLLLQRERQRVQSLEEALARLQADAAETRKTMAGLQARLQQAESEPAANPWVVGLAALAAVLAALLAALAWQRWRPKAAAPWWKVGAAAASLFGRPSVLAEPGSTVLEAEAAPSAVSLPALPADSDRAVVAVGSADVSSPPDLATTSPRWITPPAAPAPTAGPRAPAVLPVAPPPAESSSVEELIDLEQQAEFFVVLGQDDAAIDLLSHHLDADGAASPLPYLKLLEIHRRRGDRSGYDTIQVQFNRDFNAYAPEWGADLQQGRALEDYPEVVERLQRHWGNPPRAMELLEAALFRRGGADATFDLPAYRELLSLYSIAREHAQKAASGAGAAEADAPVAEVDLLLPLDGAAGPVAPIAWRKAATTHAGRLTAANPGAALPATPLDVDLLLPVEPAGTASSPSPAKPSAPPKKAPAAPLAAHYESLETVPSALPRPNGHPDESVFVDLVLEPVDVVLR